MSWRIEPLGELALRLELPAAIDRRAVLARLRALPGAIDACVTESHACVRFEREVPAIDLAMLETAASAAESEAALLRAPRVHRVGAVYDGPDLDEAAERAGLDRDALIATHAGGEYVVSFVGFLPGFAYLRGLDERLARVPRRSTPRPRVAARSIAMAGGFTGIYPFDSPGGWNVLGRAPTFAPLDDAGATLAIGDRVRFERIG